MGTTLEKPADAMKVACEMCLKEVPVSEAKIAEAADYFAYFCGLECYEQWRHRGEGRPFSGAPRTDRSAPSKST